MGEGGKQLILFLGRLEEAAREPSFGVAKKGTGRKYQREKKTAPFPGNYSETPQKKEHQERDPNHFHKQYQKTEGPSVGPLCNRLMLKMGGGHSRHTLGNYQSTDGKRGGVILVDRTSDNSVTGTRRVVLPKEEKLG